MPYDAVFDYQNQPVFNRQINTYQYPGTAAPPDANAASAGREFLTTATNSQSLGILGGRSSLRCSYPTLTAAAEPYTYRALPEGQAYLSACCPASPERPPSRREAR